MYVVLIIIAFIALLIWGMKASETATSKKREAAERQLGTQWILTHNEEFTRAAAAFNALISEKAYINHRRVVQWKSRFKQVIAEVPRKYSKEDIDPEVLSQLRKFINCVTLCNFRVGKANEAYVRNELMRYKTLFDTIEKYPLNNDQRRAIVHDEDANLVIAGAGTGKTSSIVGKVTYLLASGKAKPDEILLLAFTNKAVDEMRDRIRNCSGGQPGDVEVRTFHGYGLDIISSVRDERPDVANTDPKERHQILARIFDVLMADAAFAKRVVIYFAYYMQPVYDAKSFDSLGDYYRYLKSQRPLHLRGDRLSMKGDALRSFEEVDIANFMFTHGVDYEYEADYCVPTSDRMHRQYKPDFFLPAHDIYIEHYGIDRQGNVPSWFSPRKGMTATQAYTKDIEWKRNIHRRNGTTLVETYSYEKKEGTLFGNLTRTLQDLGVVFRPRSAKQILEHLRGHAQKPIPHLVKLVGTFLELTKSNGFSMAELRALAKQQDDRNRTLAFLDIFEPIYESYEAQLRAEGKIDFSDMIAQATSYIENAEYPSPFKYILVDEFQDISVGRYRLLQELINQKPEQRLYCVGDDWQSIFRFTGSDISAMVDFEEKFGYTKTTSLDVTYRFGQSLVDLSSGFVMKNPYQLTKEIESHGDDEDDTSCEIRYAEFPEHEVLAVLEELDEVAQSERKTVAVAVLGRYSFDKPKGLASSSRRFQHIQVEYSTVHKAKGLEWDYVIVTNVTTGKYGFPTEICDDPILELVLSGDSGSRNSEERRLFYVALTRARRKVYVVTNPARTSTFVKELEAESGKIEFCPECKTGFLVQRKGGEFIGCDNYPYCTYTVNPDANPCPSCNTGSLVYRFSKRGRFLACSNRACSYTESADQELCPQPGCTGHIVRRQGPRSPFLGCSNFHSTGCRYTKKV